MITTLNNWLLQHQHHSSFNKTSTKNKASKIKNNFKSTTTMHTINKA